jgi:hypothetical protein
MWRRLLIIWGLGVCNPLAMSIMDPNTIHGPTVQKMAAQHRDRFRTSTWFDDSRRLRRHFEVKTVLLEALWTSKSKPVWDLGVCMISKGEEALFGYRRTGCWTLMSLHFETQLYLQSNRDMYIWNQVSCTKSYYKGVMVSSVRTVGGCTTPRHTSCLGLILVSNHAHSSNRRATGRSLEISEEKIEKHQRVLVFFHPEAP